VEDGVDLVSITELLHGQEVGSVRQFDVRDDVLEPQQAKGGEGAQVAHHDNDVGVLADQGRRETRGDEAISAWQRAIDGDGDSVDRGDIEKKVKTARQKLPKK